MNNLFVVDIFQSRYQARDEESYDNRICLIKVLTCLLLSKTSMFANMVTKITSREIIHHKIQVLPILESVVHIDDEGVMKLG